MNASLSDLELLLKRAIFLNRERGSGNEGKESERYFIGCSFAYRLA